MSLFRYLVQGFGWRVGARAAEELLEDLDERLPDDEADGGASAAAGEPSENTPPSAWQRWSDTRRAKKAQREREAEAARSDKAIDDELEALKRKIGR